MRRGLAITLTLGAMLLAGPLVGLPAAAGEVDHGEHAWPPVEEATIRPGIKVQVVGHGWCTANFVFTDPAGEDLFLGTAAHCMETDVGAPVRAPSDTAFVGLDDAGPVIGHVAYSSWAKLGITSTPCLVVLSCTGHPNDFALVRIDEAFEEEVHPAVLGFGGPTGLAPTDEVVFGDRMLSYGNSPLRPGPGVADEHAGVVTSPANPWTISGYFASPGIPGDSGSPVLSEDGRAVGVLTTLSATGANGVTALEPVLAFAQQRGMAVELATWGTLGVAEALSPGSSGPLPAR